MNFVFAFISLPFSMVRRIDHQDGRQRSEAEMGVSSQNNL
jgi:hypothetical protein